MALTKTELNAKKKHELIEMAKDRVGYDPKIHKTKPLLVEFLNVKKVSKDELLERAKKYKGFRKTKQGKNIESLLKFLGQKEKEDKQAGRGEETSVVETVHLEEAPAPVATPAPVGVEDSKEKKRKRKTAEEKEAEKERKKKEREEETDAKPKTKVTITTREDLYQPKIPNATLRSVAKKYGWDKKKGTNIEIIRFLEPHLPAAKERQGVMEIPEQVAQVVEEDAEIVRETPAHTSPSPVPPPVVAPVQQQQQLPAVVATPQPSPRREAKTESGIAPININRLLDKPSEKEIRQAILHCLGLYHDQHDDNDELVPAT